MSTETQTGEYLNFGTDEVTTVMGTAGFITLEASDDPGKPLVIRVKMEPNTYSPAHAHPGWSLTTVIQGELWIGDVLAKPGDAIRVPPFVEYGPLKAGPEGATVLEFSDSMLGAGAIWDEGDELVKQLYSMAPMWRQLCEAANAEKAKFAATQRS